MSTDDAIIPFNRSSLRGRELEYISDTIRIGQVAGDQTYSRKCQAFLRELLGVRCALVTTSCTHALEMTALLLDIGPGDEVIVPSFTFVSTANAFALHGARPVFCDIRPDTLNIDESQIERAITPRTKAIVPVHYAGVGCEMDTIWRSPARHGLAVIEDNAHGLFGRYRGRMLGTLGQFATQSFHETKNITCGEGGALMINDQQFVERAEIIREKGTDRSPVLSWTGRKIFVGRCGSSYTMSDVLAAFLYGQLEEWRLSRPGGPRFGNGIDAELESWAAGAGVARPAVPEHCQQAFHMYQLIMPDLSARTRFIAALEAHGILAVFHYLPLHLSEYARRWGGKPGDCPVTEMVSDRLVRLPFFIGMTDDQQSRVIDAMQSIRL